MGGTSYIEVEGGQIAYEVTGQGPLVLLCPGLADTRATYRFLAPLIAEAGFRVATVDLRGHGESSVGWSSYSRTDTAGDLLAVARGLDAPAVIVGQSFSGGSATIAAATAPEQVSALVEIGPFTRSPGFSLPAFLRNDHDYRRGALLLGRFALSRRPEVWAKYLEVAYPGDKPSDWETWLQALLSSLREPGRMDAAQGMLRSRPADAAAQLAHVRCPAMIVMGTHDSDFAHPEAEAASIVESLPSGLGRLVMVDGAGHYPHAQMPQEVAAAIIPFLNEHARA